MSDKKSLLERVMDRISQCGSFKKAYDRELAEDFADQMRDKDQIRTIVHIKSDKGPVSGGSVD